MIVIVSTSFQPRIARIVAIGRLADTAAYVAKPGYCVLRDLPNWTVAVKDAFVYDGTDRGAHFLLVSPMPQEIMAAGRSH